MTRRVRNNIHDNIIQPYHCIVCGLNAKSNNRKRGQLECDVTWFCFCFDFVRSHCTVRLFFHSLLESRGGGGVKLDVQGQGSGIMLDVDKQGVGCLEN